MRSTLLAIILIITVAANAGEPRRGYRGFADWDNCLGQMDYTDNTDGQDKRDFQWAVGIATSHGYQFNQHVFVGVGFMIAATTTMSNGIASIFADFRYDYSYRRFKPFGDIRLGYSCFDDGIYFSPTIGHRFNLGRKANLNLGLGMTLLGKTTEYTKISYPGHGKKHHADPFFTFRIGVDF